VGITFEHPAWLLLILAGVPLAAAGLRLFAAMSRVRRWSAVVLRVLLISLISAMLAGASSVRTTQRVAVIGVVDVSTSVRLFGHAAVDETGRRVEPIEAARRFLEEATRGRGPDDLLGLVVFDGRSLAVAMPGRGSVLDRPLDVRIAEGTDIAAALRYAAALVPPDAAGRLVLLSDGVQTAGDAAAAARELSSRAGRRRVPVDVAPVRLDARDEVMVEGLDAPPRAAEGATITLRATLRATGPARGRLSILSDGEPLDVNGAEDGTSRPLELDAGTHVELVTVPLPAGKIHRFEAVWEPEQALAPGLGPAGATAVRLIGDTRQENNRAEAFTLTPGKGKVLLVDGVSGGTPGGAGSTLARTLERGGIKVAVVSPEGMPQNLLGLQEYDLVILENVAAESVPEALQKALVAHVRDLGAGLVMIGGPDSLGPGGWKGSELAAILPVRLDLPEKLVQPDAAVIFVMDNSGSMGRGVFASPYSQQEIANRAAALAVKSLDKKDLVGVIVFNSAYTVLKELSPNADPAATAERIMSVDAGGGTVLGPALGEAHRQLLESKASVKHVLVISDGASMGRESLPGLAGRMKADGITVSTIGVGDAMDTETMALMASRGGGQFYAVSNPSLLPKFFLKAVRVVRTPLIREGRFDPVLTGAASPLTAGIPVPPPLLGMVLTQARPEPTITVAMLAPTGEPLLAHWNVGLGQVAVWTSDAHEKWAAEWIDWPGFAQLWTQTARTLSRPGSGGQAEITTEIAGDTLKIRMDATDERGKPMDLLTVPANVYAPGAEEPLKLTLSQTAPGVYEGTAPARESGTYIVTAQPRAGNRPLPPVFGGASRASGVELRRLTTDSALLSQIAATTGGRELSLDSPAAARLYDRAGLEPVVARTPLWRALLLWTLIVLMLDIGTRRIAWDRFTSREFGVELKEAAAESVRERGTQAARTVEGLRGGVRRPAASGAAALSDEDARKIADEQAERRREARAQKLAAVREQMRAEAGLPAPQEPIYRADQPRPAAKPPPPAPEPGAGTQGLLAAKKRARERLGGDGEET
jgi:Ca-activated chloride channel homolog